MLIAFPGDAKIGRQRTGDGLTHRWAYDGNKKLLKGT